MDRSNVINLVAYTYQRDSIGQRKAVKSSKKVFCNIRSVTRQEWKDAGEMGLKPALVATMFKGDYDGEQEAEFEEKEYGIYRTYFTTNDEIELYLELKAGVERLPED